MVVGDAAGLAVDRPRPADLDRARGLLPRRPPVLPLGQRRPDRCVLTECRVDERAVLARRVLAAAVGLGPAGIAGVAGSFSEDRTMVRRVPPCRTHRCQRPWGRWAGDRPRFRTRSAVGAHGVVRPRARRQRGIGDHARRQVPGQRKGHELVPGGSIGAHDLSLDRLDQIRRSRRGFCGSATAARCCPLSCRSAATRTSRSSRYRSVTMCAQGRRP